MRHILYLFEIKKDIPESIKLRHSIRVYHCMKANVTIKSEFNLCLSAIL